MDGKKGIIMLILCCVSTLTLGMACCVVAQEKEHILEEKSSLEAKIMKEKEMQTEAIGREEEKEISETTGEEQTQKETEVSEAVSALETMTAEFMSEAETETESEAVIAAYTVAIDPGHQGDWVDMSEQEPNAPGSSVMKRKATTGTQGFYTGIPEYQLNLDISLALRTELESRGYRVVLTREDNDTAISNAERATLAWEQGGDIYVRIHANGSEDHSVQGALGMSPSFDNPYVGYLAEESHRLADCILNSYCGTTGFANLGVQYYDDMTGINWSQIPVMILEMGFMTNESDDYNMADASMREKMVLGIADGIDLYFER